LKWKIAGLDSSFFMTPMAGPARKAICRIKVADYELGSRAEFQDKSDGTFDILQ
jgi:hypothetical protein